MNEDLQKSGKFKRISTAIFGVFLILTIVLPFIASYIFNNYWLLFGIIFSYLGYAFYNTKFMKAFFILTIAIIIYWIDKGFHLEQELTFFWLSFLFGNIFKIFIDVYEGLSKTIIDEQVTDINSTIKSSVETKLKQNNN